MWFLHAPGSGVWINVGRTLDLPGARQLEAEGNRTAQKTGARLKKLLVRGEVREFARQAGLPLATARRWEQRRECNSSVACLELPYDSVHICPVPITLTLTLA
jgi:hypothetical protein